MRNRKGLDVVVTTLIIVLLAIVAIGIIWVVVRGVTSQQVPQKEICATYPIQYSLNCEVNGSIVPVFATTQNLQKAIDKYNCTVLGNQTMLSIDFCNPSSNETQYKILTQKYN